MTENAPPPVELRWTRAHLEPAARPTFDRALADLSRRAGTRFRLARLASRMVTTCRVGDLRFARVVDDSDPPRAWPLAVDTRPEQRILLPAQSDADFAECCDLLGLRSEADRARFRAFLELSHGAP